MKTGFVILAAGAGRRMGGIAKCLLELDGRTLLERLLAHVQPLRGKARHDQAPVVYRRRGQNLSVSDRHERH